MSTSLLVKVNCWSDLQVWANTNYQLLQPILLFHIFEEYESKTYLTLIPFGGTFAPILVLFRLLSSKMSSQESSDDHSAITQESLDSEIENLSQIWGKSKIRPFEVGNSPIPYKRMVWKVNSKKGNGS